MNIKKIILFFSCTISLNSMLFAEPAPIPSLSTVKRNYPALFDTKTPYKEVVKLLKEEGFREGFYSTSDKLKINYLYRERPKANKWIVFCSGWFPGRKEGLAIFYALLPEDCNLLFFDARGHGKSQGSLFGNIFSYGKYEYKDVIAAVKEAHTINNLPIFIYGTCAGAFHACYAVAQMEKNNLIPKYNVQGLIFDSGWVSVESVSYTSPKSTLEDMLIKRIAYSYNYGKNKKQAKNHWLYRMINPVLTATTFLIERFLFRPLYRLSYPINLNTEIDHISIPILFIHSRDDAAASFLKVKWLSEKAKNKTCWWIEEQSKHACHFLIHTEKYQTKVINFLNENLN